MPNSLFQQSQPQNNVANILNTIKQMGNPQQLFQTLMQNNPAFNQFVNLNAGKPVEQIAKENGIDFSVLQSLLNR